MKHDGCYLSPCANDPFLILVTRLEGFPNPSGFPSVMGKEKPKIPFYKRFVFRVRAGDRSYGFPE
jgi:hypothetical protein